MRIAVQQFLIVVMSDREKEKTVLPKITLDAADDYRGVGIAEIPRDHSDGVSALHPQRARQIIRAIIQFARRGLHALLGAFWHRARRRGIVQYCGNSTGRESYMLGHRLQRDDAQLPAALILATAFHGAVSLKIPGRKII